MLSALATVIARNEFLRGSIVKWVDSRLMIVGWLSAVSYASLSLDCTNSSLRQTVMCDYTQVQFKCCHLRYLVQAWCVTYQQTHVRCPVNIVAM